MSDAEEPNYKAGTPGACGSVLLPWASRMVAPGLFYALLEPGASCLWIEGSGAVEYIDSAPATCWLRTLSLRLASRSWPDNFIPPFECTFNYKERNFPSWQNPKVLRFSYVSIPTFYSIHMHEVDEKCEIYNYSRFYSYANNFETWNSISFVIFAPWQLNFTCCYILRSTISLSANFNWREWKFKILYSLTGYLNTINHCFTLKFNMAPKSIHAS